MKSRLLYHLSDGKAGHLAIARIVREPTSVIGIPATTQYPEVVRNHLPARLVEVDNPNLLAYFLEEPDSRRITLTQIPCCMHELGGVIRNARDARLGRSELL